MHSDEYEIHLSEQHLLPLPPSTQSSHSPYLHPTSSPCIAANVGHNGTGRVAEPIGAHEEWRTVGGLLVAQNFCRLCLVCTRIRGPGINLNFIFVWGNKDSTKMTGSRMALIKCDLSSSAYMTNHSLLPMFSSRLLLPNHN